MIKTGANSLVITPGTVDLCQLRFAYESECRVSLSDDWRGPVEQSVASVEGLLADGATIYGVNTGFGLLAKVRIPAERLQALQLSIVRSHAAGVGAPLDEKVVRLVLLLKAASLARGFSAVRPIVIERLLELLNAGVIPVVPSQGSVGASGDLAPLAHLSLVLLGEGEAIVDGRRLTGAQALRERNLEPIRLDPKEGLALLNGTQVSTALALAGLFEAEDLCRAALMTGAMSVEASLGSHVPFSARIQEVRGHRAQIDVASAFRAVLNGSEIMRSHLNCDRVQDPYSLRCQPQVLGACLQQLRHVAADLEVEANAVTDNPLVFADDHSVVSGGNFHAELVAMCADSIAIALAEIGALSERRIALLVDAHMSQLPAFLVRDGGVNSGFMLAQVTAAALASENKSYAHPASVDSLPTSANQEDHVSMATFAARRLGPMSTNVRTILAIELLAASQGIDFRRPLTSSPIVERAHALLRKRVPFLDQDRHFAPDIEAAHAVVGDRAFLELVPAGLTPSFKEAA
ncbi:MAG: histidine ammonia-lyase [Steroidobacteraceae bacterium]|jgi:histidine ammonia-lyase